MASSRIKGSVVEQVLVLLGTNSHVLLAQVVHMSIDVVCVLQSISFGYPWADSDDHTSCSARGTLLSLSL